MKRQQTEDSRASNGLQRDAFSCAAPHFLCSSVIIHTPLLLYAVAFTEVLHSAPVYELMTSPRSPAPPLLTMTGSSIHDNPYL